MACESGAVDMLQYQVWWSTSSFWLVADDSSNARSEFRAENVLTKMNDDRIDVVAKNDPLVVKFGEALYEKHGHHDHLHGFISNKLTEVLDFRAQTEGSTCLEDCIKPSMFPVVVKAVKVTAG